MRAKLLCNAVAVAKLIFLNTNTSLHQRKTLNYIKMSALDSGKAKLGDIISFDDLPKDRNDNLWNRIENKCHLTIGELSALKNAVCSSGEGNITPSISILP